MTLDVNDVWRYAFRHDKKLCLQENCAIFVGLALRSLALDIQQIARRKLKQLDSAILLDELRIPPGNRLEILKGNRKGQWSIRINDQWRICFCWKEGEAFEVEIVDYH